MLVEDDLFAGQREERCGLLLVGAAAETTERLTLRCRHGHAAVVFGLLAIYLARRLVVLIVGNIVAGTVPAYAGGSGLLRRVEEWHHSVVELGVGLDEVDQMECVLAESTSVAHFKVEPLSVVFSAIVWLQDQLVLITVHLDNLLEVATLEARLEDYHVVLVVRLHRIILASTHLASSVVLNVATLVRIRLVPRI